jgi:hypothetical protein
MLRAYADRGLRVTGLRMQVLAVEVREHGPRTWTLLVTDRFAGARAVGRGVRVGLPRGRASTRAVALRRVAGQWRVAEVLPQRGPSASPAASTAATSGSRKR